MFNINDYQFSVELSEEDMETLKEIYEDGESDGYNDGYDTGFDNGEEKAEGYVASRKAEWIENGRCLFVSELLDEIGHSNILQLQEKTGYQIRFGGEVNVEELIEAIKALIEM